MTRVAARHGYGGASVARAAAEAGVSRGTFYRCYPDRDECFRAVYRRGTAAIRARLASAVSATPLRDRPRAVLEVLFSAAAADPDRARLILIESLAGPSDLRVDHEALLAQCIRWIEGQQAREVEGGIQAPPVALLGAVLGVLSTRLLVGQAATLPELTVPLSDWFDALRLPAGETPLGSGAWARLGARLLPRSHAPTPQPARLPRGRSALAPGLAAARLRERIVLTTAELIAARGYAAVTVSEIVAAARVSRRAFYTSFSGKEAAFLAAQRLCLRESMACAAAGYSLAPSWPDSVWGACDAMCSYMAARPALTQIGIREVYAAGENALRVQAESTRAHGLFLEPGYAECERRAPPREICSDAIGAAVFWMIWERVGLAGPGALRSLLPQVVYAILAPFLGPEPALSFVSGRVRAAPAAARKEPLLFLASADRA
ncbi:MAG TPA: TetR/AcrR family transcriptional regulator [Solirubrobacterales bacterium]|nr:TetR/AcrR family transcriptional regulator [Solirubrobacterales bacterium]